VAGDAARRVLDLAASRPATLGEGRLVCVDGPAGSGKTTFAGRLAALEPHAPVVHTDDLLSGWDGLPELPSTLGRLLGPLGEGRPGRYRRFDWEAGVPAETVVVAPGPLLVLEGVGSGSADPVTVLVWVEAPYDLRMRRGLDRDGEAFAPHWEAWARAEQHHFSRHRTRERADIVVDAEGRLLP
jgi:uridine kinase